MQRQTYSAEFKMRVVQEAIEAENYSAVARRHEVHPSVVGRWVRKYQTHGKEAFNGWRKVRTDSVSVKEFREVERENERLKKLLGEKDLEIAVLQDLVKKGNQV